MDLQTLQALGSYFAGAVALFIFFGTVINSWLQKAESQADRGRVWMVALEFIKVVLALSAGALMLFAPRFVLGASIALAVVFVIGVFQFGAAPGTPRRSEIAVLLVLGTAVSITFSLAVVSRIIGLLETAVQTAK